MIGWNDSVPDGKAKELSRQSRKVATSSKKLLLGFQGIPTEIPQIIIVKNENTRLDRTADPMMKADDRRICLLFFSLGQA